MSEIISRELLSEVLGEKIDTIVLINNKLHIGNSVMVGEINIHELAHMKCKKWAWDKFKIDILIIKDGGKLDANHWRRKVYLQKNGKTIHFLESHSNDIPFHNDNIAIFKACQWLLENKDK